ERGDVDLGLGVCERVGLRRADPECIGTRGSLCLLGVPTACLIAAPRRGDGGEGEKDSRDQLEPGKPGASHLAHVWSGAPTPLHGIRMVSPRTESARSMFPTARSIATGRKPPTPRWKGVSSALIKRNIVTITTVTPPISIACVTAPSSGSAKN